MILEYFILGHLILGHCGVEDVVVLILEGVEEMDGGEMVNRGRRWVMRL